MTQMTLPPQNFTERLLSQYTFDIDSATTNDDLTCIKCNKLLNNAYQTYCGCQYCRSCIVDYLSEGERYCCGGKEICNDQYLIIDVNVHKDAMLNKKVLRAKVICPNEWCTHSTELIIIEDHLRVCTKQSIECIECPYWLFGCDTEEVTKDAIWTHLSDETLPHKQLLFDFIEHLRKEFGASQYQLEISSQENKTEIAELRTAIERIKEECAEKENRISTLEQESRDKDVRIFTLKGESKVANDKIVALEDGSKKKDGRIRTLEVELNKTNDKLVAQVKESKKKDGRIQTLEEELIKTNGTLRTLEEQSNDTNDKIMAPDYESTKKDGRIWNLEVELNKTNDKITDLEDESTKKDGTIWNLELKKTNGRIRTLEEESNKTKKIRHMALKHVTFAEKIDSDTLTKIDKIAATIDTIDIGTNTMVSVGGITFTVDNFDTRKTEKEIINSPYFYTHSNGYKLRLRIYPADSHWIGFKDLPVHIIICKGEYDDTLVWPCNYDFYVAIKNQRTGKAVRRIIMNEDTSSKDQFLKPTRAENRPCVSTNHLYLEDLRTSGYLFNDSLTFECTTCIR